MLARHWLQQITVACGALMSCGATKQARSVEPSGFLKDYSGLRPGDEDEALLLYVAQMHVLAETVRV